MAAERKYDRDDLVPKICERLAAGEPLAVICRDIGIPRRTVNQWRQDDKEIAILFDEARDDGYDVIAQDCIAIADDGRRDYTQDEDGRAAVDHDHIQRAKLRVDTRLKLLAKWDKRRYGDQVALTGADGGPIRSVQANLPVDPADAARAYMELMQGKQ
jgi:hypothetical protein